MHRRNLFISDETIAQYRAMASDKRFPDVFAHMLYDLGFFDVVTVTAEDRACKDYGMRLLSILGGGYIAESSVRALIKALTGQPLQKKKKQEGLE